MRIAVFLFLCLGVIAQTKAQQQLYKIDYKFISANIPAAEDDIPLRLNPLSNGLLADSTVANPAAHITVYVDEQFSQLNIDTFESYIHLVDKKTKQSTVLVPSLKQYITFADGVTLSAQQSADDGTNAYQIQFVPDSNKTIAGYTCKLAIVDLDVGEYNANITEVSQIKVWYAESIPTVHWGDYTFLQEIPGAALSITADGSGVRATNIQKIAADESFFSIPEDYTLLEEEQDMDDIPLGENLFTYQDDESGLLGIWDEARNIIAPAKYTYIAEFIGDLAVVTDDQEQYGIIQKNGQELIPCSYESLTIDGENDLIIFSENNKMGTMDYNKKIQIPATFAYLTTFSSGLAIFSDDDKSGLVNLKGEVVLPAIYESIVEHNEKELIIIEDEKYALVDIPTKSKTNKSYDYLSFANEAGMFVASENGKYGYVDAKGNILIPFKYVYATPFYEGVASVNETEDGDTLYINTKGNYVQMDLTE